MKTKLYVAYGSNLNKRQMKERCPGAKFIGTGLMYGYELQFKKLYTSAFATIVPKQGACVPIGVWEIKERDERALDIYEGYPKHYFKQSVSVEFKGKSVNGMIYVMNLEAKMGIPSVRYYDVIKEGYRDCGLDEQVLAQALDKSFEQMKAEYRQPFRHQDTIIRTEQFRYRYPWDNDEEENIPADSEEGQMQL